MRTKLNQPLLPRLVAMLTVFAFSAGCERSIPFIAAPSVEAAKGPLAFRDLTMDFGDKGLLQGWGGLAVLDFDDDGDIDIFVPSREGVACRLFRNDGSASFVDIASSAGVQFVDSNIAACGVADLNNDGRIDLVLAHQPTDNDPLARLMLVLNLGGGTFRLLDESETGFDCRSAVLSIGIADLDNDGMLDFFLGCHDLRIIRGDIGPIYADQPDEIWRCVDVVNNVPCYAKVVAPVVHGTPEFGLSEETDTTPFVPGTWAVYLSDVNRDGLIDVFTLHDAPGGIDLFLNKGNFEFEQDQKEHLHQLGGWMGMAAADFDTDGEIEYFATNVGADFVYTRQNTILESLVSENGTKFHKLLDNDGGVLQDIAAGVTITHSTVLPPLNLDQGAGLQSLEFGFGCAWLDAGNDGLPDLYWAGDFIAALPDLLGVPALPFLFDAHGVGRFLENNGGGQFTDRTAERGLFNIAESGLAAFGRNEAGRAVAACDLNGDGFQDLVVTNSTHLGNDEARLRLFLNPGTNANHWIKIRLRGTQSNRFGVGAFVRIVAGGRTQCSEVVTTTSAFCGVHPEIHFGLGSSSEIQQIEIDWPSGRRTVLEGVSADQVLTVIES